LSCTAGIYPQDSGLDVRVSGLTSWLKTMPEGKASEIRTSWIYLFGKKGDDPKVAFLPLCCTTSDE
jgi:hypothetical protein